MSSSLFLRDLIFSTIFVFLTAFVAQMVLLIGTRNFKRLMLGHYYQPREIYAIFMFVDMRSSTSIAEKLGHELFSELLRDYFNDLSGPIHNTDGEEYQYVGDEVVVVWPDRHEKEYLNWIACFGAMRRVIEKRASFYRDKYGLVPEFKAGVHGGLVVVTEVGDLQKAIVYHGDVLNTSARIQSKCNETGFDLLASKSVLEHGTEEVWDRFTKVDSMNLRGKTEEVEIYGAFPPGTATL